MSHNAVIICLLPIFVSLYCSDFNSEHESTPPLLYSCYSEFAAAASAAPAAPAAAAAPRTGLYHHAPFSSSDVNLDGMQPISAPPSDTEVFSPELPAAMAASASASAAQSPRNADTMVSDENMFDSSGNALEAMNRFLARRSLLPTRSSHVAPPVRTASRTAIARSATRQGAMPARSHVGNSSSFDLVSPTKASPDFEQVCLEPLQRYTSIIQQSRLFIDMQQQNPQLCIPTWQKIIAAHAQTPQLTQHEEQNKFLSRIPLVIVYLWYKHLNLENLNHQPLDGPLVSRACKLIYPENELEVEPKVTKEIERINERKKVRLFQPYSVMIRELRLQKAARAGSDAAATVLRVASTAASVLLPR